MVERPWFCTVDESRDAFRQPCRFYWAKFTRSCWRSFALLGTAPSSALLRRKRGGCPLKITLWPSRPLQAYRPFPLPVAGFWIKVRMMPGGVDGMKKHALIYLFAIIVALGLAVSSALAQAAAESALINSMSSTSTANAGAALGRAINQASSNVQQRSSKALEGAGVRNAPKTQVSHPVIAATGGRLQSVPGGLGISVRGGQLKCDPISPAVQTSDPKSAQPVQANCGNQAVPALAPNPRTQDKNVTKSAVTSPPPK